MTLLNLRGTVMRRFLAGIVLTGAMCVPANAFAQTSAEYAVMAKQAWADLDCAALADYADEMNEFKRLFKMGIGKGRAFWEASDKGKIEQQDFNREVPPAFMMAIGSLLPLPDDDDVGLGADFVLGQLWGKAMEDVHNRAYDPKSNPAHDAKVATAIAKNEFSAKNCSLM
jgi:hypothetical protein